MPEGLEEVGIAVGLAVGLIIIAFVFFWLLPVELLPFLSEMSGSEITSPVFSLLITMAGVILIIVAILFFVKNEIFEI